MAYGGVRTKVERYNWTTVDKPGVFLMIPKAELLIDPSYQRDVGEKDGKVHSLSAEWSWTACGALIVADRADGFWVMDGQHRKLAADRRSDINELPCMVFETTSVRDEASGFLAANLNRKVMSSLQRFKALVMTDNDAATEAAALIAASGRAIGRYSDASSVQCVGAIMTCLQKDADVIRRLWPIIVDVCHGHSIHKEIVEALFYLENNLPNGVTLTQPIWRRRIAKAGWQGMLDAGAASRAYHNKPGAKVNAMGILKLLNSRLRDGHLAMTRDG